MHRELNKSILKVMADQSICFSEEYQDKYYLCKRMKERFPFIPEDEIYETIAEIQKDLKANSPKQKEFLLFTF